jgi:hypothetical protein
MLPPPYCVQTLFRVILFLYSFFPPIILLFIRFNSSPFPVVSFAIAHACPLRFSGIFLHTWSHKFSHSSPFDIITLSIFKSFFPTNAIVSFQRNFMARIRMMTDTNRKIVGIFSRDLFKMVFLYQPTGTFRVRH